ncbi:hypothetical protein K0M31_017089 [Melipona bicolor]|uniref:Uncharacterized protein n=1 Tax=Melipona bicolor TaxID=60889 RepID=A0AA40KE61_9HYME|nr:hypothetical protein K0M31_017089 [Melipona bicolor]
MAVLESDEGEEPQTFRAEILSNGRRNKTAQASQLHHQHPKTPATPHHADRTHSVAMVMCTCLPEYRGDPYYGCRPECVQNPDCPLDRACNRNKCFDPCTGVCGRMPSVW